MNDLDAAFERTTRWIERYLEDARAYPVLSRAAPGEIAAALPTHAPERGESFERILEDFERIVVPGITHWNSPRFFAYFATSASPAGVLAEALTAALDVKAMLWRTSPAATELEQVVLEWLRKLVGLPASFTGVMYDTASIAGFTALAAARERLGLRIREEGMTGRDLPALRVYITEHTHSHIEKACIALGIGTNNVVRVATDKHARMQPQALRDCLRDDRAHGRRPMAVVATAGTTSTTAVDPIGDLAAAAREFDAWLHVDAAYAGVAAIVPEFAWVLSGAEFADSVVVNPHKWLFVPMDCSVLYVRDAALLARAFTLVPEYLRTADEGVVNYMDYGLQLGRRFRALKLWFVLRSFGADGLRERLRSHVALAAQFASWVREEAGWEVVAPHPFSVVCFRYDTGGTPEEVDAFNARLMDDVNASGEMFISHTKVDGRVALRLAIGNLRTVADDVRAAWEILRKAAAKLKG